MFLLFCATIPFGIYLLRHFPYPKLICLIGGVLLSVIVFLSSYLKNFGAFVGIYAIVGGMIVGFLYYIPIMICQKLFDKNKAFVGAFLMGRLTNIWSGFFFDCEPK